MLSCLPNCAMKPPIEFVRVRALGQVVQIAPDPNGLMLGVAIALPSEWLNLPRVLLSTGAPSIAIGAQVEVEVQIGMHNLTDQAPVVSTPEPVPANHYRKKPVLVEAYPWDGTEAGCDAIKAHPGFERLTYENAGWGPVIAIRTLEGTMRAYKGDYVIRGTKGELYPCKADVFTTIYEV